MKLNQPVRPNVSLEDWENAVKDLQILVPILRAQAGEGAFLHPHEILGCATDQMAKLNAAVTTSLYTGETDEVKKRALKFAYALIFASASLDVIST